LVFILHVKKKLYALILLNNIYQRFFFQLEVGEMDIDETLVQIRVQNLHIVRWTVCCNPSLGFATKARGCKVASQEGSPRVMSHAPGSARECEGIGPHTPKGIPTLGVRVPMDSRMFKDQLQGSKSNGLNK
jgi:hypothetical protein